MSPHPENAEAGRERYQGAVVPVWDESATARRPGRGRRGATGGSSERVAGEGPAKAGQVGRRQVGPGQAGLDFAARGGRASGSAASGRGWRWIDVVTWWINLETAGVDRCRHEMDRFRNRCLDLGIACRLNNCSPAMRVQFEWFWAPSKVWVEPHRVAPVDAFTLLGGAMSV